MASFLHPPSSSGVDALGLANMIVSSARNAKTHRNNCEQLAEHVRLIGNLLEKLKSTDLMKLPATKEPLDGLEDALRKALELVESCREKSCLYMLATGWNVVYQFRQVQAEIDRYLRLVPLISLVHEFRMQVHRSNSKRALPCSHSLALFFISFHSWLRRRSCSCSFSAN